MGCHILEGKDYFINTTAIFFSSLGLSSLIHQGSGYVYNNCLRGNSSVYSNMSPLSDRASLTKTEKRPKAKMKNCQQYLDLLSGFFFSMAKGKQTVSSKGLDRGLVGPYTDLRQKQTDLLNVMGDVIVAGVKKKRSHLIYGDVVVGVVGIHPL